MRIFGPLERAVGAEHVLTDPEVTIGYGVPGRLRTVWRRWRWCDRVMPGRRRHVAGIEAVLADGTVVERLGGVLKDSTGYDWPSILVGSEGTLALITRLRLRPVERSRAAALVPVASFAKGLALAVALRDRPAGLEAAEFVLPGALALVCEELDLRPPFGDRESPSPAPAARLDGGQTLVLFESRAETGTFDLLVEALSEHPEAERAVLAESAETAGLWRYREGLDDRRAPVERAVLEAVLAQGGSIGAEHGIGRAKVAWLAPDRSPADIAAMRSLKAALDPTGRLSPGLLFG